MARNDAVSRVSSITSSSAASTSNASTASTDSSRSTATVKPKPPIKPKPLPATPMPPPPPPPTAPLPQLPSSSSLSSSADPSLRHSSSAGSRRGPPTRLKTDEVRRHRSPAIKEDVQVSPTSALHPSARAATMPSSRDNRPEFGNYRRDLSAIDADSRSRSGSGSGSGLDNQYSQQYANTYSNTHASSGHRISIPPQIPQITGFGSPGLSQVAPWMLSPTPGGSSNAGAGNSFYHDSSDNNSLASQLSPAYRTTSNPGPSSSSASGPYSTSYPNNATSSGLNLRQTSTHNSVDYSPDNVYFNDDRRPSVASIATTASSTGSRASDRRQGGFRKLQGFFGEEFPGRDASDGSLSTTTLSLSGKEKDRDGKDGKDKDGKDKDKDKDRSHSYSHGRPHRDRNYSNATDRDTSPSSSRPRTPVPAPKEVVPFLYQEADDIARYGEAPVRDTLSGPDRERYVNETSAQNPPKTSSSSRSGHSIAHLPHHRHNKSNDDHRLGRQVISREDSIASMRERATPSLYNSARPRAQSPTPSGNSGGNSTYKGGYADGQASPPGVPKKGIFTRFIRSSKDKDDGQSSINSDTRSIHSHGHGHGFAAQLKKVPHAAHSLSARPSRVELPPSRNDSNAALMWGSDMSLTQRFPQQSDADYPPPASRHGSTSASRQATFNNKFPFSKKNRTHRNIDENDEMIGPTDHADPGTRFYLDTDLNNMDGIVHSNPPLPPMDADVHRRIDSERIPVSISSGASAPGSGTGTPRVNHYFQKQLPSIGGGNTTPGATAPIIQGSVTSGRHGSGSAAGGATSASAAAGAPGPNGPNGAWNAPDSWGVRRVLDDATHHLQDEERTDDKQPPFCIRVFKSDKTFATVSLPLNCTVQDVIAQIAKRVFGDGQDYQLVLQRAGIARVLSPLERPMIIQKRILQQIGYEKQDHLEDLGREDNSYFCRFLFMTSHESDVQSRNDLGFSRMPKLNHVDLSGRNLITIPISLYSKAAEITSLNLSRNLSLDIPRDFIQSCLNLRDIKYSNNEARKIPPSLGRASRLTLLDVSNNSIETMEHAELEDITGVLKLNLANNRLVQLPSYFCAYHSLRTLNISSNFLDKFPGFLCELGSLIDLDLSFNLISSLPDSIGNLRNLEKFVITNNRLTGPFPPGFQELQSLRELDIKYNTITNIDVISELPKLEILTADHNAISQFSGTFERLRSLKLNANPITRFDIVSPLPTLKLLNLSHAQLASIDDSFNNMRNLERLHLDNNYFVSLPNQIGNLGRLETFSIANNSVGELPPEIGCLTELKTLDVRGNNMRKLPMEIWWANKLETLNASSNVLDNFPKPASRPPQVPSELAAKDSMSVIASSRMNSTVGTLSSTPSSEELSADGSRRPSQASSTLLAVGTSPVPSGPDRKSSVVSVYGKGGRKTSVVSRSAAQVAGGMSTPTPSVRKDSGLSARMTNTFAGSLRNLYIADNQLDDDSFDQLVLLGELRVLNMSYNDLTDVPQRSMKSWPQLVELYLSGNELTTLPADDLGEYSMLQTLHINNNKFTNLPADISRAKKLTVLDCGNNSLKYNISNVPYDWNWNLNQNLRYLNLSGNRRLEIKAAHPTGMAAMRPTDHLADFSQLVKLRVLGLMDVTLTQPSVPDQNEDRRVRTLGSIAGFLPYGMADTLGKNEHLSTMDLVVPRFSSTNDDPDLLIGLFDGQALSSGGSKIAKFLHENFSAVFTSELKALKPKSGETIEDALRRAFLTLNKDLVTSSVQGDDRALPVPSNAVSAAGNQHRGSIAPMVLTREDLNSGGVATVAYLVGQELYVANVGDTQAMLIQNEGSHRMLTRKHDPAEPSERSRIRDAGGWVSRNGRLNDALDVSRAFGYSDLMPSVMAAPHIMHHTVRDQDETVIIATKELWEYLKPGLVVDVARQERGDLMRASQKLRDLAMAYGASGKLMVMMLSVADLKRKTERSRLHRGQSMSMYGANMTDDLAQQFAPTRRGKRTKGEVLDSTLQRLDAEVPAPTGLIAIVFTDIKSSTNLWETYPAAMRSAIKLHNELMRRQLRIIGGFEVKTEGDAFMVSFPTATSALLWALTVQLSLLEAEWPAEMLNSVSCQPIYDGGNNLIFRGLSVRMGIHWGEPLCEPDPITRRMDYYGPMVNKAARINSVADGGQITVSSDFISEIQRCLETYQETPTGSTAGLGEDRGMSVGGSTVGANSFSAASSTSGTVTAFEDDPLAPTIRKELKLLSDQGFLVTELGEIKLKGLENPEVVYSLYPTALSGRKAAHIQHERMTAAMAAAASAGMDGQLQITGGNPSVSGSADGSIGGQTAAAAAAAALASEYAAQAMGPGVRSLSLASSNQDGALTLGGNPDSDDLRVIPEMIWGLWRVSLRLEMLCSSLEEVGGHGLQPPETELLERMKQRGANVTEAFLINFLTHQISRIETCINTLTVRHMAFQTVMAEQRAASPESSPSPDEREKIQNLDDLRGSMTDVFAVFAAQMAELQAYRAKYGPLHAGNDNDARASRSRVVEEYDDDEGSDTEQE